MLSNQLAVKYAKALCALAAEQGLLAEIGQQLTTVVETVQNNPDLKLLFYHPLVEPTAKKDTLAKIFGNELQQTVRNFLFLVIDKHRELALPSILRAYIELANERQNIVVAQVTTVQPLTTAQEQSLALKLGSLTGKNIVLEQSVDPRLIGGITVAIGDKLIDGSVACRLAMIEAALTRTPLTKIGVTG